MKTWLCAKGFKVFKQTKKIIFCLKLIYQTLLLPIIILFMGMSVSYRQMFECIYINDVSTKKKVEWKTGHWN